MPKQPLSTGVHSAAAPVSLGGPTESDNGCLAKLAGTEYGAQTGLRECAGCGRRFVPAGKQKYCDHACYAETLKGAPIEQRFWSKVNKNGPVPPHAVHLGQCWLWTASTIKGYGQLGVNRKPAYAHRLAWEFAHGPIPPGLFVLHRCDAPLCVRIEHLFLGSQQTNLQDARDKGRLDESLPRTRILTLEQREAIYAAPAPPGYLKQLMQQYGVSKAAICKIRRGEFARWPVATPRQQPANLVLERVPSVQLVIRGEVA